MNNFVVKEEVQSKNFDLMLSVQMGNFWRFVFWDAC